MVATLVTLWLTAAGTHVRVAEAPFEGNGVSADQLGLYERQVRSALRRCGLPVDTVEESRETAGAELLDACGTSVDACRRLQGVYPAVLVGEFIQTVDMLGAHLTVVDTASGRSLASEDVRSLDSRAFLDGLTAASSRLAETSAIALGLKFEPDAPLRPYAVYPLVAGGVLIGTGIYFLIQANSDANTLKNNAGPLDPAVAARNSGPTNQTLGWVLTSVGVASTIVGVILFAPGAERRPLVAVSVDPTRGMLTFRGALP